MASSEKRIRTVLYQDQRFTPAELEVLHTPALQRLYDLHQLGFADRVFVDASHSRFHHVVGVLAQVDNLLRAIVANLRGSNRQFSVGAPDGKHTVYTATDFANRVEGSVPICRFIGLLHDLTHAPFGHTVEDEIHIVASRHDDPDRQAEAFYRLVCQLLVWLGRDAGWRVGGQGDARSIPLEIAAYADGLAGAKGENEIPDSSEVGQFGVALFTLTNPETRATAWRIDEEAIYDLLVHLHVAMTALLHLDVLHSIDVTEHLVPKPPYPFQTALEECLSGLQQAERLERSRFVPHRDAYLLDVVGNTVCADLLDYAQRDSHFTNLRLAYDPTRIAENFTVVSFDAAVYAREGTQFTPAEPARSVERGLTDPFAGRCVRTAISLFSHKFRSDVPGELMNLLNARFHLYERAIYHPTKCVAGAMLGTALQLLGWRRSATNPDPLPSGMRHLGDAVFLSDVMAGAYDFQRALTESGDTESSVGVACESYVSKSLVEANQGRPHDEVLEDVAGGIDLMMRMKSRRYYRQVYRALPNTTHEDLGRSATLAGVLKDAERRYVTERAIERKAGLRRGSVVIHCPKLSTATKVANVLLVMPTGARNGGEKVYKLCHISEFHRELFGRHGEAVAAVTAMYKSMWRLGVFVSPEYLSDYRRINRIVGEVITDVVAADARLVGAHSPWANDPLMDLELQLKLGSGSETAPALTEVSIEGLGELRVTKVLASARPFLRRTPPDDERTQFFAEFASQLAGLSEGDFKKLDANIHSMAVKTEFANAADVHGRGSKLHKLSVRLREELRELGVEAEGV